MEAILQQDIEPGNTTRATTKPPYKVMMRKK
jgi:hypothetical protein